MVKKHFVKDSYYFRRFTCWIPTVGANSESTSANVELSLRNKNMFGNRWSKVPRYIREI